MFSPVLLLLVTTLAPLIAGLLLIIGGQRLSRTVALGIALVAALLAFGAATIAASIVLPEGPQMLTLFRVGNVGIVQRIDGLNAYLLIGVTAWVTPLLIWITTPRAQGNVDHHYSARPMGLALVASSLALSAVLDDNVWLSVLCWSGTGLMAWLIARPDPFALPHETQEWLDLLLMTLGPIAFGLAMFFPIRTANTQSLLDLAGRNAFTFASGFLVIVTLAFACGAYPFILWLRRVTQGLMTESIAVLLLLITPISVVMLGRLIVLIVSDAGKWPTIQIGPATVTLNVLLIVLGIATVLVSGLVLLFEHDLPIIAALLGLLPIGWSFVAVGVNESHALLGLPLLLLAYIAGVGTLLLTWTTIEWGEHDLASQGLMGLAKALPFQFVAFALAMLTLVGVPFFAGFPGMAIVDQGLLGLGGAAPLAGALLWFGNALALVAVARFLGGALSPAPERPLHYAPTATIKREGIALSIPIAILLLVGIAPEILLFAHGGDLGPAHSAANALLTNSTIVPDVTTSALGLTIGNVLLIPGIFWLLGIGGALIAALAAGLIGSRPTASPVFVGGEPLHAEAVAGLGGWGSDLVSFARLPIFLPGPASWREDLGDTDNVSDNDPTAIENAPIDEDVMSDAMIGDEPEFTYSDIDEEYNETNDTADDIIAAPHGKNGANGVGVTPNALPTQPQLNTIAATPKPPIVVESTVMESDLAEDDQIEDEGGLAEDESVPLPPVANKPTQPRSTAGKPTSSTARRSGKGGKRGQR